MTELSEPRRLLIGVTFGVALAACAGKAEHSTSNQGEASPAQKPAAGPADVTPERVEPRQHLLMVVELEPASRRAQTLTARSVDLPLPKRRGKAQPAPWRVDVLGVDDKVLYSAPLADTSTVRGEFRDDATGELRGVSVQKATAAVTLRLPLIAAAKGVRVVNVSAGAETELGRVAYPQVQP